jgi:hypothetical protein
LFLKLVEINRNTEDASKWFKKEVEKLNIDNKDYREKMEAYYIETVDYELKQSLLKKENNDLTKTIKELSDKIELIRDKDKKIIEYNKKFKNYI